MNNGNFENFLFTKDRKIIIIKNKKYQEVYEMKLKKTIALILSITVLVSTLMIGCSKKDDIDADGFENNADEFVLVEEEVTDENGEVVTDADGNAVMEEVAYKVIIDDKGNKVIVKTDKDGNPVKDDKGEYVTVTTTTEKITEPEPTEPTTTTTMKSNGEGTTEAELTTKPVGEDKVPSTSATGKAVTFSAKDQTRVKDMLEVPYLYKANYENADGVPTQIASHAAIWMAEREGLNTKTYASGTIVLGLFRYFGQTVVNFKTLCNEGRGNAKITYNSGNDTFSIPNAESSTHTVSLDKIEFLGNNNYYKVTASVSGAGGISKVTAVIQRNKLDSTLGFSIKALKWS